MAEAMTELRVRVGNRVLRGEIAASFEDAKDVAGLVLHLGKDKQSPVVTLTDVDQEERERMLGDLLFQGTTTRRISIGNRVEVLFKTLDGTKTLELDSTIPEIKQPEDALRKWDIDYEMIRTLGAGIESYDGKSIGETRAEREKYVLGLNWSIILYLGGQWNKLMADIAALLQPDIAGDILPKFSTRR